MGVQISALQTAWNEGDGVQVRSRVIASGRGDVFWYWKTQTEFRVTDSNHYENEQRVDMRPGGWLPF